MKTRENELHEPFLDKVDGEHKYYGEQRYNIKCTVCHATVGRECVIINDDNVFIKEYHCPNYCPNCGARLKDER